MDDNQFAQALEQAGIGALDIPEPAAPDQAPQADSAPAQPSALPDAPFDGEDVSSYFDDADFNEAPAETPSPARAESAHPQAASPDVAALLQRNQELLQQQFALQSQQRDDRIRELEARLQAYEQTPPANNAAPTQWYEDLDLPELDDTQKQTYQGAIPVIEAVARRQALEIARLMQERLIDPRMEHVNQVLQPMQESLNISVQQAQAAKEQSLQHSVRSRLPWLTDEVRNSQEYAAYYNAVIPGTGGLTRKTLVEQALAAGNADATVDLLQGFKPSNQNAAQHVAPGRANTATPTTATAPSPRTGLRLSTYNKALKDYSNGTLSPTKFAEIETAWYNALAAGTAVVDE